MQNAKRGGGLGSLGDHVHDFNPENWNLLPISKESPVSTKRNKSNVDFVCDVKEHPDDPLKTEEVDRNGFSCIHI